MNVTLANPSMASSISELREQICGGKIYPPGYAERMFHAIPDLPTVKDRKFYLTAKSNGKIILDIGCTGTISKQIREVAKKYYGVDQIEGDWFLCDVDHRPDQIPVYDDVEIIICSEVLEHLANPGYFLLALKDKYPGKDIYLTVPNAGAFQVRDDCEIVHKEHVSWYSYTTLHTLLTRYGFTIQQARWYGQGEQYKAEGIIAVIRG